MATNFQDLCSAYLRAGFPWLYLHTPEEIRVEQDLAALAATLDRPLYRWSITKGWIAPDRPLGLGQDPLAALGEVSALPEGAIGVLRDFHFYLESPEIIRKMRDMLPELKLTGRTLLILACRIVLPPELEKDITVVPYALPTREELDLILTGIQESAGGEEKAPIADRRALLDAASGLTQGEAENAFALAVIKHGGFPDAAIKTVQYEKAGVLRKTGILEYYEPDEDLSSVGGLDALKEWLKRRAKAFLPEARAFGLPSPRGLLLVGVPGTGKSLTAKAAAATWKLPLIRLDLGKIFGSLVGESESRLRQACAIAEALAPCVLWVDEIEKGIAGFSGSGQTDSGVTARVVGALLTWLNEKTAPVFLCATANQIHALPPELLRKGRFDEIFFVDLPTPAERLEILSIHLAKRNRSLSQEDLAQLIPVTEGFGGSELECVVIDALYQAFDQDRDLCVDDLKAAASATTPLAKSMKERIDAIREWAATRARPATTPVAPVRAMLEGKGQRRMSMR